MPQMAPMNWITLTMMFMMIFMMMNCLNYFDSMNHPKKMLQNKKYIYMTWKW